MTGAMFFAIRAIRSMRSFHESEIDKKSLLVTSLFLVLLILSKSVYVLILPVFTIVIVWPVVNEYWKNGKIPLKIIVVFIRWCVIPLAIGLITLLIVNDLRFGSPLNNGYTQWIREREPFSGNFLHGFWGFLFNTQFGIFTCFPVLLVALFFWREFRERFPIETNLILAVSAVVLITYSFYIRWSGPWCYGPRYMMPILPLLSLPFLFTLQWLLRGRFNLEKGVSFTGIAMLLIISFYMQLMVNSLPFFVWWNLREGLFAISNNLEVNEYLDGLPFGLINSDLKSLKTGGKFPPLESLKNQLTDVQYSQLKGILLNMSQPNYYWFRH
jgi:hypothetical protein